MKDNQKDTNSEEQEHGGSENSLTTSEPPLSDRGNLRLWATVGGVLLVGGVLAIAFIAAPEKEAKKRQVPPLPSIEFAEAPTDSQPDFDENSYGDGEFEIDLPAPLDTPRESEPETGTDPTNVAALTPSDTQTQIDEPSGDGSPEITGQTVEGTEVASVESRDETIGAPPLSVTPSEIENPAPGVTESMPPFPEQEKPNQIEPEEGGTRPGTDPKIAEATQPEPPLKVPNTPKEETSPDNGEAVPTKEEESPQPAIAETAKPPEVRVTMVASDPSVAKKTGIVGRSKFHISEDQINNYRAIANGEQNSVAGNNSPSMMSITEAQDFASWLTERDHRSGTLPSDQVYRLPTPKEMKSTKVWRTGDEGTGKKPFGLVQAKERKKTLVMSMKDSSPAAAKRGVLKQSQFLVTAAQIEFFRREKSGVSQADSSGGAEPAEITLAEARSFIRWLNKAHRGTDQLPDGSRYDLPRRSETRSSGVWRVGDSPNSAPRPFGIVVRK